MARHPARIRFSRRLVTTALAALVVVAAGGWYAVTSSTIGDVDVKLVGAPTCRGAEVTTRGREPAIVARPGMSCVVRAQVRNNSGREVTLTKVTAPFAGPETGALVEVRSIASDLRPAPANSGIDAAADTEMTIPAGERAVFQIALAFHEDGCQAAGVFRALAWPRVEIGVWGRSSERGSVDDLQVVTRRQQGTCST